MTGTFVAVVGPSGVGKDSLLSFARARLGNDLVVVRRAITRAATETSEDHDSVSVTDFLDAVAAGRFSLHWQAHGLYYGLPKSLETQLADGKLVIANFSRAVLSMAAERYENMVVVEITARPEVIAQRLQGRGRESAEEIEDRLKRSVNRLPVAAIEIDNSGDIAIAGERFVELLHGLMEKGELV